MPATQPPKYTISDGVNLVPINKLAEIKVPWKRYVVIGAGKTGLDALLYLIDNNVDPAKIVWIVSNDCWYINRTVFCCDVKKMGDVFPRLLGKEGLLGAEDVNDAYEKLEALGQFMRLDKNIWPTKMRAATVSEEEINKIRRVGNVVRLGRIESIEKSSIIFKQGDTIPTDSDTLHVDCTAAGLTFTPPNKKIFEGNRIHLYMCQVPQACTSGAMIAAVELKYLIPQMMQYFKA